MASFGDWLFGTSDTAISDASGRQTGIDTAYEGKVNKAMAPYDQLSDLQGATEAQKAYTSGLMNIDTDQYKTQAAQLNTGNALGDVNSFMDPSLGYQMDQATKQVESSQAGKGGLFSGAAGKSIAGATQKIAEQGWGDAYSRANQALQQSNAAKLHQQQAGQSAGTYNLGLDTTGLQAKGQAYNTLMDPINTRAQGTMDMAGTIYGSQSGMNQQKMQGQMADNGYFGDILNFGAKVIGG